MRSAKEPNALSTNFLESVQDSFMYQHVDRPTRLAIHCGRTNGGQYIILTSSRM